MLLIMGRFKSQMVLGGDWKNNHRFINFLKALAE